jgi:SWI/SNF-related matrix-associated actin-dependent regulator 1 of chromatin subfamily A
MTTQLWLHQRTGADWLKDRNRAYLGDRPRVGKTRTLATALNETLGRGHHALVICPAIVRTHWRETLADVMGARNAESVLVASYDEIVRWGAEGRDALFEECFPDVLILDEAHLCKNMLAQRTQLILGREGYARKIPIVWAASGTPVPRHPGEWYAIGATMFPRTLLSHGIKRYEDFEHRFLIQREVMMRGVKRFKVVGLQNDEEFRDMLAETTLQRTLDDIGDEQPKLLWQVLAVDGDTTALQRGLKPVANVDAEFYKNPNASHIRKLVGLAKVAPVANLIVTQLSESTEKLVVFAHHLEVLDGLEQALVKAQIVCVRVDGSTSQRLRDARMLEFQRLPGVQVFLGQNIACMMGIDLSSASSILSVEPDWVATNNDQMGHRILGPNQKSKHVVTQMISLAGTIDDSIIRQNAREAAMQDRMFEGKP